MSGRLTLCLRLGQEARGARRVLADVVYEYKLLATKKTSTMQNELQELVEQGFAVVGLTVGETMMGGSELVTITRRQPK